MASKERDALQLGTRVPYPVRYYCRHLSSVVGSSAVLLGCWASFSGSALYSNSEDIKRTSPSCISYTGHSCRFYNCPSHLNATCAQRSCHCKDACANPNGQCNAMSNALLASGFALSNTKWPGNHLYLDNSLMPLLKVTSDDIDKYAGKFNLYKFGELGGNPKFVISSAVYPDRVLSVGIAYWMYARKLDSPLWDNDPERIALAVCRPRSNPSALMIGGSKRTGSKFKGQYKRTSWMYAAWTGAVWASRASDDPKDAPEEYWVPEPAFSPDQMSEFPPCHSHEDDGVGN